MKKTLKLVLMVVVLLLMTDSCYKIFQPKIGYAETAKDCPFKHVPEAAKNIQYFRAGAFGPCYFYEFNIDELGYSQWVADHKRVDEEVGEIVKQSFSISRYNIETKQIEQVHVENGLVSTWRYTDQGLQMGYDTKRQRAYFYYHSR